MKVRNGAPDFLADLRLQAMFFMTVLLFAWSCLPGADWSREIAWPDFDPAHLPGQEQYPDDGAVCLLDEARMEIAGGPELGFSTFEHHRIVKVLNGRGLKYANVVIPYSGQSSVDHLQARSISPGGTIVLLDPKNIFDVSLYPNFVFFSDQRGKIFTMPAVEDGSVIEYEYRVDIQNRTLWHSWDFQQEVPTLISRFTLVGPSEWEVIFRCYGTDVRPTVAKAPPGFKSAYHWERRNIRPRKAEIGMPPHAEVTERLAIAPVGFRTWKDVSEWYRQISDPKLKAGPAVKELARTLSIHASDDEEKLRRIYEWVRDRVRYLAVEIGVGGFQPHAAEEICKDRYGDCKDMATLLCSLASESGVTVYPVLVSTWHNSVPDTSLASPLQFNHAIAYCPGVGPAGVWMDATDKGVPFGQIPWYDQATPVLVVGKGETDGIVVTSHIPAGGNRQRVYWDVSLGEDGEATVLGSSHMWGAAASELRNELTSVAPSEQRRWLETYLARECSGARLDSFDITGLSPVSDPLSINYRFNSPSFATAESGLLLLRPGLVSSSALPDEFRAQERVHPIRFRFGLLTQVGMCIALPQGWEASRSSVSDSLISRFGSARQHYFFREGRLTLEISHEFRGNDIPSNEYPAFQAFLDSLRLMNLKDVILVRK